MIKKEYAHILILDDEMKNSDPIVLSLEQKYEAVTLINSTEEGLDYIEKHSQERIIVLLDYHFKNGKDGDWAIQEIRKISDIIPVILLTANPPRNIFPDFINNKALGFVDSADKGNYEEVCQMVETYVDKAEDIWENSVVDLLQDYIEIRDRDRRNKSYSVNFKNKEYELEGLLNEVVNNSDIGGEFKQKLVHATIQRIIHDEVKVSEVLILDDLLSKNAPVVFNLERDNFVVNIIRSSKEGVNYVLNNLNKSLIVLLDYRFSSGDPDGDWVIKKIREQSKIIPIILFTAQKDKIKDFGDFINNQTFAFAKKGDYEDVVKKVIEAETYLKNAVEAAYEKWIAEKDPKTIDEPYLTIAGGKSYSLNDIIHEIREQTSFGMETVSSAINTTLFLLMRKKITLE